MQNFNILLVIICSTLLSCCRPCLNCNIQPAYTFFDFTDEWGGNGTFEDFNNFSSCKPFSDSVWTKHVSKDFAIFTQIHNRDQVKDWWTVYVGIGEKESKNPFLVTCFEAYTYGSNTIGNKPLLWVMDINSDGILEVVHWSSFLLYDKYTTRNDYGLIAWVYRVYHIGKDYQLRIDWELSKKIAGDIARTYRKRDKLIDPTSRKIRDQAADILTKFHRGKCDIYGF